MTQDLGSSDPTADDPTANDEITPFEAFGGHAFFEPLVAAFYARVAHDPILRPMYPDEDLAAAERRLCLFLEQYWGGPDTYSQERGHPKLRMRHMPYRIDSVARDRWLTLMHDAVVEQDMTEGAERVLWQYLVSAAFAMQNVLDDAPPADAINVTEV